MHDWSLVALTLRWCCRVLERSRNPAAETVEAAAAQGSTTLDDQVDLNVTVYNSDIALVRDVRNLELPRGTFDLSFMDIAATVNPATVHFRSLSEPSRVSVLEQNYEYDLLEPEKLLRKYVGRDVTLVRTRQVNGTTEEEEVTARLLSYNNQPVWRINGEIVTGLHADHIRFPELPDTLFTRPTLIWTLDNGGGTRHRVEAAYLAGKLSWNADYVLTVARDDKAGDIDGWVTLTNGSGTAFRNAKLQLVAGELNRVRENLNRMLMADQMSARAEAPAAPMAQEAFSDYHLYTLGRKTTINNNETKQVSMLSGTGFPIVRSATSSTATSSTTTTAHGPARPSRTRSKCSISSRMRRRAGLACRCRPAPCACISQTRMAACSSSARIASSTRRKMKC